LKTNRSGAEGEKGKDRESRSRPCGPGGLTEYVAAYERRFRFNVIGNMTEKESSAQVSNGSAVGNRLNYSLELVPKPGWFWTSSWKNRLKARFFR
jgi:hypothetical protein